MSHLALTTIVVDDYDAASRRMAAAGVDFGGARLVAVNMLGSPYRRSRCL